MLVIIPSAKIVPVELQNLGQLPAIIYPVNQKIVFEYLYEQYGRSEYRIPVFENAAKVHRRLKKYQEVDIIDLDIIKDLGYSIKQAIRDKDKFGVINFADTILAENLSELEEDAFYYTEDEYSDKWTFFEEQSGILTTIYDKKDIQKEGKGKLFVGVFKCTDLEYLKKCLEYVQDKNDSTISTFYAALQMYSKRYPMKPIKTDKWFDIGHSDKYFNSQLEVKAREFNHIKIDKERGILTKSSDDIDKFIGEIKWYLKLPSDVEYVRPRIFSYSTSYNNPYVSMEYYAYHTIHELFMYGDLTKEQWREIFKRIKFVCRDFERYIIEDDAVEDALKDMYLDKTLQRFDRMRKDDRFRTFFDKEIVVNGKRYYSLSKVEELLTKLIPKKLYGVKKFNIIHGDLCFANVMIDNNFSFIKVIDPRGKFGKFDIYGDARYEYAKLFHSVDGKYDFIIKDQFDLEYNSENNQIDYKINDRVREYNIFELFLEVFNDEVKTDYEQIILIEALLFLSMIPLHGESFEHQLVMLGTGLEILNRVADITV